MPETIYALSIAALVQQTRLLLSERGWQVMRYPGDSLRIIEHSWITTDSTGVCSLNATALEAVERTGSEYPWKSAFLLWCRFYVPLQGRERLEEAMVRIDDALYTVRMGLPSTDTWPPIDQAAAQAGKSGFPFALLEHLEVGVASDMDIVADQSVAFQELPFTVYMKDKR